jgi:hypothetical protein
MTDDKARESLGKKLTCKRCGFAIEESLKEDGMDESAEAKRST